MRQQEGICPCTAGISSFTQVADVVPLGTQAIHPCLGTVFFHIRLCFPCFLKDPRQECCIVLDSDHQTSPCSYLVAAMAKVLASARC